MENPSHLFLFRLGGLVFVTVIAIVSEKVAPLVFYVGWHVVTLLFVVEKRENK